MSAVVRSKTSQIRKGAWFLVVVFLAYLQVSQIFSDKVVPYGPVCLETPVGNLTLRTPVYHNLSLAVESNGAPLSDNDYATCAFRTSKHNHHFPHACQQLYQCWSYWKLHPNRQPVLVIPKNAKGFPGGPLAWRDYLHMAFKGSLWTSFLAGFLEVVKHANVTVVSKPPPGPFVSREDRAQTFYMHSPDDARSLTKSAHNLYDIHPLAGCQNEQPRVAIISRETTHSRKILNAEVLAGSLRNELELPDQIPIAYFEEASFRDQVQFYADADIVISSHGAQLTGIPFLNACGRVLELFPAYYHYEIYFGSLADAAGIAHYGLYMSRGDPVMDWKYTKQLNSITRRKFRAVNMCPPVSSIVEAVQQMVGDWKECCRTQFTAEQNG